MERGKVIGLPPSRLGTRRDAELLNGGGRTATAIEEFYCGRGEILSPKDFLTLRHTKHAVEFGPRRRERQIRPCRERCDQAVTRLKSEADAERNG